MTPEDIRREVIRLSPWYYLFELNGVRTDLMPPCDHHGFRTVKLPPMAARFLEGKTVLDVGCNEGGWSFAAIEAGARSVVGVDCRAVNVEKARLVARVKGYTHATFQVASADSWIEKHAEPFDFVFLFGLLYHLVAPWKTIEDYCGIAREGIGVSCVLHGGADGYSPLGESEGIAASANPREVSLMPNTSRTLIREFTKHSFRPLWMGEGRTQEFWGGCSLLLRNCRSARCRWLDDSDGAGSDALELHLIPSEQLLRGESEGTLQVVLYNTLEREIDVEAKARVTNERGQVVHTFDPMRASLGARASIPFGKSSESVIVTLPCDLSGCPRPGNLECTVRRTDSGEIVAAQRLALGSSRSSDPS